MKKTFFPILLLLCIVAKSQDLSNGLVAKYLFSGNFADSSTTGNDLELHDQAYPMIFAQDRYGNNNSALEIPDKANDIKFLVTKNASSAYDFSNEFSISYWIDFSSYPPEGHVIYGGNPNGNNIEFGVYTNSGYVHYQDNVFWDVEIHGGSTDKQFIHNVITYSNGVLSAYINGVKSVFEYNVNYQDAITNKLVIGKFSDTGLGGGGYVGYLDDIYIYNRAITQSEISLLYGDQTVGNKELQSNKVSVFPNPANNQLNISIKAKKIEIFTADGRRVKTLVNQQNINISELSSGIYFLKGISDNNEFFSTQFVKK